AANHASDHRPAPDPRYPSRTGHLWPVGANGRVRDSVGHLAHPQGRGRTVVAESSRIALISRQPLARATCRRARFLYGLGERCSVGTCWGLFVSRLEAGLPARYVGGGTSPRGPAPCAAVPDVMPERSNPMADPRSTVNLGSAAPERLA